MEIRSDRLYHLEVDSAQAWEAVSNVENYRRWWPWLHGFEGCALVQGAHWECVVQPPVPYLLRFTVDLEEVVPQRLIRAAIRGDVVGTARIEAEETAYGFSMRLVSSVAPGNRALAVAANLIKPLIRFGHDRVLDEGVRRFADQMTAHAHAVSPDPDPTIVPVPRILPEPAS